MKVIECIEAVRCFRKEHPYKTWGFVPTMGALHAGHLSLVAQAKQENDLVAVSIYVNPLQFGANEDFSNYPRTLENDLALLEKAAVDMVWLPQDNSLYPAGFATHIHGPDFCQAYEGSTRPGHFSGVATIVTKLLHVIQPNRAYFGQKDAQQLCLIKKIVEDLNFDVEIKGCPTVREPSGLALSSRNAYLTPEQKQKASMLYMAMQQADQAFRTGVNDKAALLKMVKSYLNHAQIDYLDIVRSDFSSTGQSIEVGSLMIIAVYFGKTRLIDNIALGI